MTWRPFFLRMFMFLKYKVFKIKIICQNMVDFAPNFSKNEHMELLLHVFSISEIGTMTRVGYNTVNPFYFSDWINDKSGVLHLQPFLFHFSDWINDESGVLHLQPFTFCTSTYYLCHQKDLIYDEISLV